MRVALVTTLGRPLLVYADRSPIEEAADRPGSPFKVVPPGQSNPANYFTEDEFRERGEQYMREHPDWHQEPGLRDWAHSIGYGR